MGIVHQFFVAFYCILPWLQGSRINECSFCFPFLVFKIVMTVSWPPPCSPGLFISLFALYRSQLLYLRLVFTFRTVTFHSLLTNPCSSALFPEWVPPFFLSLLFFPPLDIYFHHRPPAVHRLDCHMCPRMPYVYQFLCCRLTCIRLIPVRIFLVFYTTALR